MILSGTAPTPIERTLLTTGMLDALMRSRHDGARRETPELEIAYTARDVIPDTGIHKKLPLMELPRPESHL
jgi:hypothetical protein